MSRRGFELIGRDVLDGEYYVISNGFGTWGSAFGAAMRQRDLASRICPDDYGSDLFIRLPDGELVEVPMGQQLGVDVSVPGVDASVPTDEERYETESLLWLLGDYDAVL